MGGYNTTWRQERRRAVLLRPSTTKTITQSAYHEATPSAATTVKKGSQKSNLMQLPIELLNEILSYVLTHSASVPVNTNFDCANPGLLDATLNYSILHASRTLYNTGIPLYYALNTFSMDLRSLVWDWTSTSPSAYLKMLRDDWPGHAGRRLALRSVSKLVLRYSTPVVKPWAAALHVLRAFEGLVEVGFDTRALNSAAVEAWGDRYIHQEALEAEEVQTLKGYVGGECAWGRVWMCKLIGTEYWTAARVLECLAEMVELEALEADGALESGSDWDSEGEYNV